MGDVTYSDWMSVDPDKALRTFTMLSRKAREEIIAGRLERAPNLLIFGPPGGGKTTFAFQAAMSITGQQAHSYQCHQESTGGELLYTYLPTPEGGAKQISGPAMLSWVSADWMVVDEINHAGDSPAASTFYKVLDDPKFAKVLGPDGNYIRPKPGFCVIATMNGRPEELPAALLDRFDMVICLWRPSEQALAALPKELRKPCEFAYRNPDDAWPTYRDLARFGRLCALAECPTTTPLNSTTVAVAETVWGPKALLALQQIVNANEEECS